MLPSSWGMHPYGTSRIKFTQIECEFSPFSKTMFQIFVHILFMQIDIA